MREYQRFVDLTADIYDVALEPAKWSDVVAKVAEFVGGRRGSLISRDEVSKCGNILYSSGVDPHYIQLYAKTYSKISPLAALPRSGARVGQVMCFPDLVSYDEYRKGRYYQEWLRPQHLADTVIVMLETYANNSVFITVSRTKAMVDDEMRRRMAHIAPHARRAFLIGKAMDVKQSQAATFANLLNSLSSAVFLVNSSGQIVHANAAGHNLLYAADILGSIRGRLIAKDAHVNRTLCEVFAKAAAGGDAGIGAKGIALPLTAHDGERFVMHVLPLTAGERRSTGQEFTAAAAVFVRKAALETPSAFDLIAKSYQLTPAERRVLSAIVEVGGVPEAAQALGIAETTVKTHLYRLFEKADVGRQVDLVKLVAGFSPVIAT